MKSRSSGSQDFRILCHLGISVLRGHQISKSANARFTMPPRYAYWTILIDGKATAFRARERDDLLPTFNQLARKNTDIVMRYFARGRLWDNPEQAQWANRNRESTRTERRDRDWRPGGEHKDPRARFEKGTKGAGKAEGAGRAGKPEGAGRAGEAGRREGAGSTGRPAGAGKPRWSGKPRQPGFGGKTGWAGKAGGPAK